MHQKINQLLKWFSVFLVIFILQSCSSNYEIEDHGDLGSSITKEITVAFNEFRDEDIYDELLELTNDVNSFSEVMVLLHEPEYTHLEYYLSELALLELQELIIEYDERLIPFAEDFLNQINNIVLAFTYTIYHHDATYLEGMISDGTTLIEDRSILLDREINRVLSSFSIPLDDEILTWDGVVENMSEVALLFSEQASFYADHPTNERLETFLATYLRRANSRWGSRDLYVEPILISDVIHDRPVFNGVETSGFPEVILVFGTTAIESPFDSRRFTPYSVHLILENMEYRIAIVFSE